MRETIQPIYERKASNGDFFGYYYRMGIFAQFVTKRRYNRYSDEKWKVHINYPIDMSDAVKREYLQTVLTYLQTNDLSHKIVIREDDIRYRMNQDDPFNTQNGKIITIYCHTEWECYRTMDQLDQLFRKRRYIHYPLQPEQRFRNDRVFRDNPLIGYRYASTPRRPYYVPPTNRYGRPIEDLQEKYNLVHQK
ncbi:hypothetical protein [Tepidibacillus marianensis]|uniref:class III lanthionine synthetase LanKC N-terminal domain-containing protein n=1 Tax=Tepidibacillus marianensis TaxID=3131995 RepID=UPI0030CFDEF6